jgi:hypothetical protein
MAKSSSNCRSANITPRHWRAPRGSDLKNGGTLEKAAQMANHASTRTTQLYDRRAEEVTLDEVERILV